MQYKILADTLVGKYSKTYYKHEVIDEDNLYADQINDLVTAGVIAKVETKDGKKKPVNNENVIE